MELNLINSNLIGAIDTISKNVNIKHNIQYNWYDPDWEDWRIMMDMYKELCNK